MATSFQNPRWLNLSYLLLLLVGAILIVLGLQRTVPHEAAGPVLLLAVGLITIVITGAAFPIAWGLLGRPRSGGLTASAETQEIITLLRSINERLLLSDAAKATASRQRDRDLLRRAIQEDMSNGDLDAAMAMVVELATVYGYRQESEELREKIDSARAAQYEERVTRAVAHFEELLAAQDWERAAAEAAKIQRLFPDSPRTTRLPARVRQAWEQHKQDLERKFLEAARRDDIELAMDLLKQLDKYLSEAEAAPFKEVARGVIGKKKENLGVQFKIAVHDRDWIAASHVGDQIIREFPNTRMADEVRSMIDLLRDRAAGQRAVPRQTPAPV